jgi:hypothetical protein
VWVSYRHYIGVGVKVLSNDFKVSDNLTLVLLVQIPTI